ncbi:MAG: ABC transporter [Chitinophagales bacterium]|nr:MAG: ABC transporter [Chitinophagales bacterium]
MDMYKLKATLTKDLKLLLRDRMGLAFMFVMPIILVIVITGIEHSAYNLINEKKIKVLLCNKDTGDVSARLVSALYESAFFVIDTLGPETDSHQLQQRLLQDDYLIALLIPQHFSLYLQQKAACITENALVDFGIKDSSEVDCPSGDLSLQYFYQPALSQSFRSSVEGALRSNLQAVENSLIVQTLYRSLSRSTMTASFQEKLQSPTSVTAIAASQNARRSMPNATQHNVPAWTIFAMFFMVMSLGSGLVREKLSGSFIRLKTLPTPFITALFSRQIVYMGVAMIQLIIIFTLGIWLFPQIGLPRLHLPDDLAGLVVISLLTAWCAVNYASAVGSLSETIDQANGYGAVSVVILAAIGGIMVPAFAMPPAFKYIMYISPLYWCLDAYYSLFLEGASIPNIWHNILFLALFSTALLSVSFIALKRKNLI